jgi:hypothetical protein
MNAWSVAKIARVAVLFAFSFAASAGPGGGGHGGGGGGHGGGFHGGGGDGGFHGGFGYHGGYGGYGRRGGYGWSGYGWRGGYGWNGFGGRGWYGGWGPWGLGLGIYLPLLPWYYDTYWWNGMPYYYVDGNYYLWNEDVDQYEAVDPPAGLSQSPSQSSGGLVPDRPAVSPKLFAYPNAGQSVAQQAQDRAECERWAKVQTAPDLKSGANATKNSTSPTQHDYLRAEAACLEARNYSVR